VRLDPGAIFLPDIAARYPGYIWIPLRTDLIGPMLQPGTFALTLLLSLLTALGPLSMDMYLPSLPDIGRTLNAPIVQVQLTISSYLFGFAAGQIFYGPVSDRFGRRPVLLAALVLYALATIGCAVAQSIGGLIALRFLQAVGGAGAIVLARAVVRDIYSGVRAGRELSLMGAITGVAPIVAPVIGGGLQIWFGWRATFVLLVAFAALIGAVAARLLPETLRETIKAPFSLGAMSEMYRSVAVHRSFLAHLAILTSAFVGLFAWISGAPVVMQSAIYGLSPFAFGVTFAIGAGGYVLGTFIAARIVMRLGLDRLIGIGTAAMALGGLAMAAVIGVALSHVLWFVAAMTLYLAGLGFALPATMAGALTPFPDRAGTASSVLGFAQQTGAAITAAAVGAYLGRSAWPVASVVAVMGCLSFLIWLWTRQVRRHGEFQPR
jgi:DHA1 family bicyclomycin/chloramphenicol resistance-like MFS transporter